MGHFCVLPFVYHCLGTAAPSCPKIWGLYVNKAMIPSLDVDTLKHPTAKMQHFKCLSLFNFKSNRKHITVQMLVDYTALLMSVSPCAHCFSLLLLSVYFGVRFHDF